LPIFKNIYRVFILYPFSNQLPLLRGQSPFIC